MPTLDQIRAHWSEILGSIKIQSIPTEALLKSCRLSSVEHGTVILSWSTDNLKSRFESGKHQRLLEGVLSDIFEQKVLIRSVVEDPVLNAALRLGAKVTPVSNR